MRLGRLLCRMSLGTTKEFGLECCRPIYPPVGRAQRFPWDNLLMRKFYFDVQFLATLRTGIARVRRIPCLAQIPALHFERFPVQSADCCGIYAASCMVVCIVFIHVWGSYEQSLHDAVCLEGTYCSSNSRLVQFDVVRVHNYIIPGSCNSVADNLWAPKCTKHVIESTQNCSRAGREWPSPGNSTRFHRSWRGAMQSQGRVKFVDHGICSRTSSDRHGRGGRNSTSRGRGLPR